MNRNFIYGGVMIQRCADVYGSRWCPCCGSCSCRIDTGDRRPVWAPAGSDPGCPMHGVASLHGHVKVLTCEPDGIARRGFRTRNGGSGRDLGVQDAPDVRSAP